HPARVNRRIRGAEIVFPFALESPRDVRDVARDKKDLTVEKALLQRLLGFAAASRRPFAAGAFSRPFASAFAFPVGAALPTRTTWRTLIRGRQIARKFHLRFEQLPLRIHLLHAELHARNRRNRGLGIARVHGELKETFFFKSSEARIDGLAMPH